MGMITTTEEGIKLVYESGKPIMVMATGVIVRKKGTYKRKQKLTPEERIERYTNRAMMADAGC